MAISFVYINSFQTFLTSSFI